MKTIKINPENKNVEVVNSILKTSDGKLITYLYGNTEITEYSIPDSITTISGRSFGYSTILRKIIIPSSVNTIEWNPFVNCKQLQTIEVDEGNEYFKVENGVLFTKDGKEIVTYLMTNQQTH